MKKLIPIIVIIFLCISNIGYCYITAEEREKFDKGLYRIQQRQDKYKYRKEADKRRIERYKEKKQKELQRKQELKAIADRNTRNNIERLKRNDAERLRNLKIGQCTLPALTGKMFCK